MATTMAEKLNKEGGKVEDVAMGDAEAAVELVQLQTAYAFSTPLLEKAGEHAKAGMGWLQNALGTVTGTQKVYQLLQDRVDDASFVACLERASEAKVGAKSPALEQVEREVLDEQHGDHEDRANASAGAEGLSEGWELVEKEEVIDAMASFIAAYIQAHPKASKLNPQELQKALGVAIKEIRKSKVVVLWEWSSAIWRLGAMSYGAFTMYTNPWLARAVLQAVWCCSRLAVGATATAVGLLV